MNQRAKKSEIKEFQKSFKSEMPRVVKQIEIYEKALKLGTVKTNIYPAPQFKIGKT